MLAGAWFVKVTAIKDRMLARNQQWGRERRKGPCLRMRGAGLAPERVNDFGSSLVYGHPQAPTRSQDPGHERTALRLLGP